MEILSLHLGYGRMHCVESSVARFHWRKYGFHVYGSLLAFCLSLSLAFAPLLVKVYRVYSLLGSARRLSRKTVTHRQAALCTVPIFWMDFAILLVFALIDPPRPVQEVDYDSAVPIQSISCQQDSIAFFLTETLYHGCFIVAGCALSSRSRNLDVHFGEAKQLLFPMYNVAFTGIVCCALSLSWMLPQTQFVCFALPVFSGEQSLLVLFL